MSRQRLYQITWQAAGLDAFLTAYVKQTKETEEGIRLYDIKIISSEGSLVDSIYDLPSSGVMKWIERSRLKETNNSSNIHLSPGVKEYIEGEDRTT